MGGGGGGGGGEGAVLVVVAAGDGDGGGGRVNEREVPSGFSSGGEEEELSSSSSSALRSSPASSLTDDGELTSSSARDGDCCSFSSESEEEMMRVDGEDGRAAVAGGGPLYELAAPLLAQLPVRTGLSKYYQGKSQSFTSLYNARSVEDLAKKTTSYSARMKLHRGRGHGVGADRPPNSRHAPGPCSKTIAKKAPRCSSDRLLSRARRTGLFLHSSVKTPAIQSNKEPSLSRC